MNTTVKVTLACDGSVLAHVSFIDENGNSKQITLSSTTTVVCKVGTFVIVDPFGGNDHITYLAQQPPLWFDYVDTAVHHITGFLTLNVDMHVLLKRA